MAVSLAAQFPSRYLPVVGGRQGLPSSVVIRTVVQTTLTQFTIQQFYVLPTQCIYVFCVDLRTNSDYFPIQH